MLFSWENLLTCWNPNDPRNTVWEILVHVQMNVKARKGQGGI